MPDSALLSVLSSAGVAGVFCILFICGLIYPRSVVSDQKEEISELKADRDSQRDRADNAVAAMQATRDVLTAMQTGFQIAQNRALDARPSHDHPELEKP